MSWTVVFSVLLLSAPGSVIIARGQIQMAGSKCVKWVIMGSVLQWRKEREHSSYGYIIDNIEREYIIFLKTEIVPFHSETHTPPPQS